MQVESATFCASCQDREVFAPADLCDDCQWLQDLPDSEGPRIRVLRQIVRDHQFAKIDGYAVDVMTASLLCQVYDALNESNRARFGDVPLLKLVDLAWKSAR